MQAPRSTSRTTPSPAPPRRARAESLRDRVLPPPPPRTPGAARVSAAIVIFRGS